MTSPPEIASDTTDEPEWVLPRAFGAVALALPSLVLAILIVWLALDLLLAWGLRSVWTSAELMSMEDLWKVDDAFHLGVVGTRDALWERVSGAIDRSFGESRTIARLVLGAWALLTAFSQTYFSIGVSRRAGDALPSRSNLLHAVRRVPRVLMAWTVVAVSAYALLFVPAIVMNGWTLWVSVPVQLTLQVVMLFVVTRTSFVVAIAVADDHLTPGWGWAQCLAMSWREVQGRTFTVFLRLFVLTFIPAGLAAGAMQAIAFAEGVTGAGIGLAIATELTIISALVTVFVGAGTALYVIDYRLD